MKLTVLVDNNTFIDQYYVGEPAVSYYIELGDKKILFDTGYSDVFLHNADKMRIDFNNLTHIVLSHGHNDHTNGLKYLSESKDISHVNLIAHPHCFLPKYAEGQYIGAPFSEAEVSMRMKCGLSKQVVQISRKLFFLGEIPRINDFEAQTPIGYQIREEKKEADFMLDDSALVYQRKDGIFIITGCSHSGICNIVEYAKQVCGENHILGIIGGFHLFDEQERIEKTIDYFKANSIDIIYPCHCVSLQAIVKMANELPIGEVGVGMTIEI